MKKTILIIVLLVLGTSGLIALMAALDFKNQLKNSNWYEVRTKSAVFCFIPVESWKDEYLNDIKYESSQTLDDGLQAVVIPTESREKLIEKLGNPTQFQSMEALEKYWTKQKA